MSILNHYIVKEIVRVFATLMVSLISLFYIVDFFEKIDNFINAGISIPRIFVYFAFKLPFVAAQMIPICLLLAVIIAFGLMNRHNELIAFRINGVSIIHLLKPVLAVGGVFGIALFMISEAVVPVTISKANRIWLEEVNKKSVSTSKKRNIWIKEKRKIIHIEHYNPTKKTIFSVVVYEFDHTFNLVRRVDASKGVFKEEGWVLFDVMEQKFNASTGIYDVMLHRQAPEFIDLRAEDLTRVVKGSEEMGFTELMGYIHQVKDEGYDATPLWVDLHAKAAFPFICLLMSLIGTGIAAKIRPKESLPIIIAAAIGIAFLYWTGYGLFLSLGYGEVLPPLVAAWTANAVFLFFGIYLLAIAD
ncbi:MAG: LPS export ABC transporter permease LptG [Thermodesulfobacteriota bacterium]|nr:LPS export ABC transporter permease LptG [Thermodesulfobacteriota bacterium]